MKTINLSTILKEPNGEEYKNKQELGSLLMYCLNQKQEGQDLAEAMLCYSLSKRIFKGGEVELTANEIEILKAQVNNAQNISRGNLFSVVDILEG